MSEIWGGVALGLVTVMHGPLKLPLFPSYSIFFNVNCELVMTNDPLLLGNELVVPTLLTMCTPPKGPRPKRVQGEFAVITRSCLYVPGGKKTVPPPQTPKAFEIAVAEGFTPAGSAPQSVAEEPQFGR